MAANLLSDWAARNPGARELPPNYALRRRRPGGIVPRRSIPVIDMADYGTQNHCRLVRQLMAAAKEFGIFEVVHHGIPLSLSNEARAVFKEFFDLPAEEKGPYCSRDLEKKFIVYTSSIQYESEALHYWRDASRHLCTPMEECIRHWPTKPVRYREVVAEYVAHQKTLGSKLLSLVGEGLGLGQGFFERELLAQEPNLTVNHYPACPEPDLTWGSGEHFDPGLMTILLQDDVPGLQLLHKGKWVAVDPPNPDALLVNVGNLLEIVSNGELKSVKHRVVADAVRPRTTAAFFMEPNKQRIVGPALQLLNQRNPPRYKPIRFCDMLRAIRVAFMGETECAMDEFMESLRS